MMLSDTMKSNHIGYMADALFLISAFFSLVFLAFGGYNHTGEGIVRFVNNKGGTAPNIVPSSQEDNIRRDYYVGFDRVCVPRSADTYGYTHCYNMHPMEHDDLKLIVPIYWTLFAYAVAHFILKRVYIHRNSTMLRDAIPQLIAGFILFLPPIVLFIISSIYWARFIENDKDRTITQNDDVLGSLDTVGVTAINLEMEYYRENELSKGTTWSVLVLLIGQLCQSVACLFVMARSWAHKESITGAVMINHDALANDASVNSKIGAPVDAAAKNPETKAKAATAKTATVSVYADRRVANGIRF